MFRLGEFMVYKMDKLIRNEGLQHLAQKIFQPLDLQSLQNCRVVCKAWQRFIDQNIHWETKLAQEMERKSRESEMIFDIVHCFD